MSEIDFIKYLKDIGISLSEKQLNQFRDYANYLLEYNKHTNLTAIRNIGDVYLKHFYDSLLICKFYKFNNESVLDIGSGAGFPGVPLKIVFPNIKLTLLDSNGKKTRFLETLKEKLNIDYIVIYDRAENFVKASRERFDIVTSRAVTSMPVLAELSLPFVKLGGMFIPYKGNLDDSIENGIFAIETLGGEIKTIEQAELPLEKSIRNFVFVIKKCKSDDIYPRMFDKINKKPLQKLTK